MRRWRARLAIARRSARWAPRMGGIPSPLWCRVTGSSAETARSPVTVADCGGSAGSWTTKARPTGPRRRLDHQPRDGEVEAVHHVEDRLHDVPRRAAQHEQDQQERANLLELMDEAPRGSREDVGQEVTAVQRRQRNQIEDS